MLSRDKQERAIRRSLKLTMLTERFDSVQNSSLLKFASKGDMSDDLGSVFYNTTEKELKEEAEAEPEDLQQKVEGDVAQGEEDAEAIKALEFLQRRYYTLVVYG